MTTVSVPRTTKSSDASWTYHAAWHMVFQCCSASRNQREVRDCLIENRCFIKNVGFLSWLSWANAFNNYWWSVNQDEFIVRWLAKVKREANILDEPSVFYQATIPNLFNPAQQPAAMRDRGLYKNSLIQKINYTNSRFWFSANQSTFCTRYSYLMVKRQWFTNVYFYYFAELSRFLLSDTVRKFWRRLIALETLKLGFECLFLYEYTSERNKLPVGCKYKVLVPVLVGMRYYVRELKTKTPVLIICFLEQKFQ